MKLSTKELAVQDIMTADRNIKKRHRYFCGIVNQETKEAIGCGDLFFESPDGQNGELYYELRKLGWSQGGFNAEYNWKIRKGNIIISYTEGDIYIKELEKNIAKIEYEQELKKLEESWDVLKHQGSYPIFQAKELKKKYNL